MTISGLGIFFFIHSVSTYVSSDSSDSFFFPLFLIKIYTQNFRLHYFLNHHHLKISTDEILFPSPKHLHCNGEGDIKSKPFSQQWPGGGTPSAWHSCLLGGSWEKVVLSFQSLQRYAQCHACAHMQFPVLQLVGFPVRIFVFLILEV